MSFRHTKKKTKNWENIGNCKFNAEHITVRSGQNADNLGVKAGDTLSNIAI
jgi:hypothetical protein